MDATDIQGNFKINTRAGDKYTYYTSCVFSDNFWPGLTFLNITIASPVGLSHQSVDYLQHISHKTSRLHSHPCFLKRPTTALQHCPLFCTDYRNSSRHTWNLSKIQKMCFVFPCWCRAEETFTHVLLKRVCASKSSPFLFPPEDPERKKEELKHFSHPISSTLPSLTWGPHGSCISFTCVNNIKNKIKKLKLKRICMCMWG